MLQQTLLITFCLTVGVLLLKKFASLYSFKRKNGEITKLNSVIAILKLRLKSRITQKCNRISSNFKSDSEILVFLAPLMSEIQGLEFAKASDYQKLLDNLIKITEQLEGHHNLKNKTTPAAAHEEILSLQERVSPEMDRMKEKVQKLIKYDKAELIVLIQIVDYTNILIIKMKDFNKAVPLAVEKIEIAHFYQLTDGLKQSLKENNEKPDILKSAG